MPSLPVELPEYTVHKPRKRGWAFYFQVPADYRPEGWLPTHRLPIKSEERTGRADADEIAAVCRDAKALYEKMQALARGEIPKAPKGSIPWLIDVLEADEEEDLGWAILARKTQEEYSRYFRHLRRWSEEAKRLSGEHPHITALDGPTIRKFLSRYKASPRTRELMASAINKLFAVAIATGEAVPTDNPLNPAQAMKKARRKKRKKTAERVLWAPELQGAFFERCRVRGKWGLLLALGFIRWQTQRVEDAIHLHSGWLDGGWFAFDKSKDGKHMRVPVLSEMRALLDEVARVRGVPRIGFLAINDTTGKPYFGTGRKASNRQFHKDFAEIRNDLGKGFAHLEAQHLRHTGIIEMGRAGLDLHQIRTRTGHSYKTIMAIIEHYLPEDEQIALAATLKLEEYRDKMKGEADV